jgi:DNA mismatch repair ATPase MutS
MPRHATPRGSLIQDIDHELKSVPDFDYCMSRVSRLNAKLKHLVRRVDKLKRKTDKLVFGHAKHFEKFQKANDKVIEYWNALGDLRVGSLQGSED